MPHDADCSTCCTRCTLRRLEAKIDEISTKLATWTSPVEMNEIHESLKGELAELRKIAVTTKPF